MIMTSISTRARSLATTLALAGLLGILGCSDDGLDKRYPVSGTVTYNGKPLESGSINFVPEAVGGRGAVGEIKNGAYTLTTQTPGDGAFPGKYSVTVVALAIDTSQAEAETKKLAAKSKVEYDGPMLDQAALGKALKNAKSNVPAKYGQIDTSGFKAEVKTESNKFNFELKD